MEDLYKYLYCSKKDTFELVFVTLLLCLFTTRTYLNGVVYGQDFLQLKNSLSIGSANAELRLLSFSFFFSN